MHTMAYGAGGADNSIKPEDVYNAIEKIVSAEDKIKQEWEPDPLIGLSEQTGERPEGFGKIMICAFLLAMDCMPKGGTLSLTAQSQTDIEITGTGENAAFREHFDESLALSIPDSDLEPKLIHPYAMGLFCKQYGFGAALTAGDNAVTITLKLPS